MKRIGVIVGALVTALAAVILIAPSFIDWTEYRASFESRIASGTGRDVSIDGDVSLALLPRPALRLGGLRVGSIAGATDQDFARADAVAVNLAFGPLLSGRLQFTSIEIINPIINAELLSDGRATWSMKSKVMTDDGVSDVNTEEDGFDLGIDSLVLVDAVLNYRNATAGSMYQVTELDAELRAESMAGPYSVVGNAKAQGLTWQLEASVGVVRDDRPSAVAIEFFTEDADVTLEASGQFNLMSDTLSGAGRVSLYGESAEIPIRAFLQAPPEQPLPAPLRSPYNLQARFELDDTSIAATDVQVLVGGSQSEGAGGFSWGSKPRFDLDLKLGRLDLESWIEGAASSPTRFAEFNDAVGVSKAFAQSETAPFLFALPSNLDGTLNLKVDLIEWRGQVVRDGVISASLADAELTLVDVGAQMPGNASVQVSGFVRAEGGQPVLDLTVNGASRNLRGFLGWLDLEPSNSLVPPSRLNSLDVQARVFGPLSQITVEDIELKLDTTQLTGSAEYVSGDKRRIDLNLALSNLDLDSYLPALRESMVAKDEEPGEGSQGRASPMSQLSGFVSVMPAGTTHMKIVVGTLTAADMVMTGVDLDVSLSGGNVSFGNLSVENIAGARVALGGSFRDLSSATRVEDFVIELASDDLFRTARALNTDLPLWPLMSGPVQLTAKISGGIQQLNISLDVSFGDLSVLASGTANVLDVNPSLNANLTMTHPRYASFLESIGSELSSDMVPVGPVEIKTAFSGDAKLFTLAKSSVQAGESGLTGDLVFDSSLPRPSLKGSVSIARLDLDSLAPPDATAELTRASRSRSTSGSGAVSGRWSNEPINVSNMSGFDADLNVTADQIVGRGLVLERFTAPVKMTDGVVTITAWQGALYGGPASGDLTVWLEPMLRFEARLDVKDALIERMNDAGSAASSASGKASLQGSFLAAGATQRELVTTLSGNGGFVATGLDASGAGQGPFLSAALSPVRAMGQLGGLLGGGVTKGFASMSASFNGESGVFMLSDATVKSNVYSGEFAGAVDLPRWWVEADGRVRLEANIITQLLGNRLQLPSLIPVSINGPLNAPNVKMDTNSSSSSPTISDQPAAAAQPIQMPTPPNPLDIFQGILNEVTKPQ